MKKGKIVLGKAAASLANFVVSANVNSTCAFKLYQPELPTQAKKFSKINNER